MFLPLRLGKLHKFSLKDIALTGLSIIENIHVNSKYYLDKFKIRILPFHKTLPSKVEYPVAAQFPLRNITSSDKMYFSLVKFKSD